MEKKPRLSQGATNLFVTKPSNIEVLVDITRLPLDYMKNDEEGLRIGFFTHFPLPGEIGAPKKEGLNVLAEAAIEMGSVPLRNMATVGGNICKALPITELCPALMVLGASLRDSWPLRRKDSYVGRISLPVEEKPP